MWNSNAEVKIIEFRSNVKMSVTFCRTEVLIRTHTHTSYYIRMSDKPANGVNNNQNCSNRHLSEMAIGWSISLFLLKFNYMYANPSEMITCEWRANIWWISFKVSQIQIQYHIHTHTLALDGATQTINMQQDIVVPQVRYTLPNWKAIKTCVIEVLCVIVFACVLCCEQTNGTCHIFRFSIAFFCAFIYSALQA